MAFKLPETLTEKEAIQIAKSSNKKHHQLAILIGFYQGMRISEVQKLKQEDIDFDTNLIWIKQAKGSKDRKIPIMPEFRKTLLRLKSHLPFKCSVRALQYAFSNALEKSGIKKEAHFHTLRHSCATWLLNEKKLDIRYVQQFLGHSRLDTTQIYTHVSPQNLLEALYK